MLEAVVVYRPDLDSNSTKKKLEAFFTTLSEETNLLATDLLAGPAEKTCEAEADPEEEAPEGEKTEGEKTEGGREENVSEKVLQAYGGRWAVETCIRTAKQHFGLGEDQCRRWRRIEGANAFRMFMAAAQGLFFAEQVAENGGIHLTRWRPWYRQKQSPSGEDVLWACREELLRQGIIPTVGFEQGVGKNPQEKSEALARAG